MLDGLCDNGATKSRNFNVPRITLKLKEIAARWYKSWRVGTASLVVAETNLQMTTCVCVRVCVGVWSGGECNGTWKLRESEWMSQLYNAYCRPTRHVSCFSASLTDKLLLLLLLLQRLSSLHSPVSPSVQLSAPVRWGAPVGSHHYERR